MRKRKTGPAKASVFRRITVFSSPRDRHHGLLCCGALTLPCALGRGGVTHLKREGDGATPAGRLHLLSLTVRPDRGLRPRSSLPIRATRRTDGWCEDAASGRYNRPIRLPARDGYETMWRSDDLYDIVGVLDWNMRPRVLGRGSAIFLHLARPGYAPTAGCIALKARDLRLLLAAAGRHPLLVVAGKPRPIRSAKCRRRRFN